MLPVVVQAPVAGLNSSALVRTTLTPALVVYPPATSTWPLGSKVAVWPARILFIVPVSFQGPGEGVGLGVTVGLGVGVGLGLKTDA